MPDERPASVDGIGAPQQVELPPPPASAASPSPKSRRGLHPLMLYGVFAVIYVLAALVFMAMFPRVDGAMEEIKLLGTAIFAFGAIGLLLLAFLALLRVRDIKDRPKAKTIALLRICIGIVPLLFVSAITALLINLPPKISLEIITPTSEAALVAPVSVTIGLPTAMKSFAVAGQTPLKFEWDFNGDGTVDQETFDPQATYIFSKSGVYGVAARVTMTSGVTKTLNMRLVIPRSSFGVQPIQPIVDEPVSFTLTHLFPKDTQNSQTPTVTKAAWDFDGDGTVDLETNQLSAVYTYHAIGSVQVSVQLTLSNQTQSTLARSIDVVEAPPQPFPITLETEPSTLLGPPPFGVLFILKTAEQVASASWDFGDQKTAEGLRVAHVYSAVGNYTVTATVRSGTGSTARLTKIVRVTNPLQIPDLQFEGNPPVRSFTVEGEVPLTVDLTPSTSLPLISFSWDGDAGEEVEVSEKSYHAVFRDVGKYFVDLIGTDPEQNVYRKRITINALPAKSFVNFSMDPESPTAPATVKFDGSDTFVPDDEITGFEWDFGDDTMSGTKFSGARIDHTFEKPGTYRIRLTVRTTSGKSFQTERTLTVRAPLLDACFVPSRKSGQAPLGVRFDTSCTTGTFAKWMWDFGDSSESDQQSPTHVYLNPGEFLVTLTATSSDGFKSTKTSTISVSQ